MIKATRYHDISCGHRVVGHEGKCRHLHGHNYRIHFECVAGEEEPQTDAIGRVIDFSEIKSRLCMWLEENWDHKFIAWENDPVVRGLLDCYEDSYPLPDEIEESMVFVPFNPTAENMALYLLHHIGPQQLNGTGILLRSVVIEETAKCSASADWSHL